MGVTVRRDGHQLGGSIRRKVIILADDLLDQLDDDFDVDDLLDEVVEDDSEGWVPSEPCEGISGVVVAVGETRSNFAKDGEDPMVPTVTIQVKDGSKYRVIGYGTVLRRELMDANPKVGDLIAVKYFGEKRIKKGRFAGNLYRHFGVVVRRR